jgi:hypothetical protein
MRRIELRVKGPLSYPQSRLTVTVIANPLQWPSEWGRVVRMPKSAASKYDVLFNVRFSP